MTDKLMLILTGFLLTAGCTADIKVEITNWSDMDIPFEINDFTENDEFADDDGEVITDEETEDVENSADDDSDADADEKTDEDIVVEPNCSNANCSNLGFCFVNGGVPECFCPIGYHDEFPDCIENNADSLCSGVSCSDNGSCVAVEILEDPVCACESGYLTIGLSCIQNVSGDPCDYVECGPDSECVFDYTTIDCKCKTGYLPNENGWGCVEDKPDPCEDFDCGEHGECKESNGKPVCECEKGYFYNGKTCVAESERTCDDIDCSGHGECVEAKEVFYCRCDEGYYDQGYECLPETGPECVNDFDCYFKCGVFNGSCVDSKCNCM